MKRPGFPSLRVLTAFVLLAAVFAGQSLWLGGRRAAEAHRVADAWVAWNEAGPEVSERRLREYELGLARLDDPALLVRRLPPGALDSPPGLNAVRRWRDQDRLAVLAWLSREPGPLPYVLPAAVENWIATDVAAVVRYLAACPEAGWRGKVVDAVALDAISAERPQAALALLARFPGSPQALLLRETAYTVWAELDPEGAKTAAAASG